ncbi:MAG: DUF3299 domain-containing protein [Gammaproteobacteria bacterium]
MKFSNIRIFLYFSFVLLGFIFLASKISLAKDARVLDWGDLAPEGYFESLEKDQKSMLGGFFDDLGFGDEVDDDSEEAQSAYDDMQNQLRAAPIVPELNGEYVKIAGFIVPLEFDFEKGTFNEFLLAPYFGACIHVPPPPSNQIVYVKSGKPLKQQWLDDATWVTGTLTTDSVDSEYGFASYTMSDVKLEIYDEE